MRLVDRPENIGGMMRPLRVTACRPEMKKPALGGLLVVDLQTPTPRWDGVTFAVSGSPGIYRRSNDSTPIFMAQGVFVQVIAPYSLPVSSSPPHQLLR